MRVLHVVPSVGRQSGGLTTAVVGLVGALQDQGVEVIIHTTDSATPPQARVARRGLSEGDFPDRFHDLHINFHAVSKPYCFSYSPQMLPALRAQAVNFDLIHIHGLFLYPQFAAFKASKSSGTPYIVSTHGMLHPHFRKRGRSRKKLVDLIWQGNMLRQASALHATSQVEEAVLQELGYESSIRVIPNGISTAEFSHSASGAEFRSAHDIPSNTPLILTHGRVTSVKGLDVLINALPQIKLRHPDARVVIVGPDDEGLTPSLIALAERIGVAGSVLFLGSLQGERLLEAIDAADVWSLLSHSDSFGLAALEALAAGKAVVASKYVDLAARAVQHNALVTVDTSPDEAAVAISDLLSSNRAREELGRRAKYYSRQYDWSNVACEFVDLYEDVLRRSGGRKGISQ